MLIELTGRWLSAVVVIIKLLGVTRNSLTLHDCYWRIVPSIHSRATIARLPRNAYVSYRGILTTGRYWGKQIIYGTMNSILSSVQLRDLHDCSHILGVCFLRRSSMHFIYHYCKTYLEYWKEKCYKGFNIKNEWARSG